MLQGKAFAEQSQQQPCTVVGAVQCLQSRCVGKSASKGGRGRASKATESLYSAQVFRKLREFLAPITARFTGFTASAFTTDAKRRQQHTLQAQHGTAAPFLVPPVLPHGVECRTRLADSVAARQQALRLRSELLLRSFTQVTIVDLK